MSELHPPTHLFCSCNYTFTVKNSLAYPYLLWALFSRFSEKLMPNSCAIKESQKWIENIYLIIHENKTNSVSWCETEREVWIMISLSLTVFCSEVLKCLVYINEVRSWLFVSPEFDCLECLNGICWYVDLGEENSEETMSVMSW